MELKSFLDLIKYFELGAAIVGFLNYRKLKGSFWVYFPFFLITLFVLECVGLWFSENKFVNLNLYKFIVIPYIFISYSYFFKSILSKRFSNIVYIGLLVFALSLLAEATLLSEFHPFYSSFSLSVANVFFLIYVLRYYIDLVHSKKILTFYNSFDFWFCSGILIFYLGCLPYFSLYNLLATKFYKSIFLPYTWVFIVLNYIMYLLFSIGFIWNKRK